MNEIWKDIPGYEGYYQISNSGSVRSLDRYIPHPLLGQQFVKGKTLKYFIMPKGYYCYVLQKDGIRGNHFLHRLLAEAFIPNTENKPCVNHKNGVKIDNNLSNLEWVTYSENTKHAFDSGLKFNKKGADDELSIEIIATNIKTNEEISFGSQREASRKLGIRQSAIWRLLNNQLKKNPYNFIFRYAN